MSDFAETLSNLVDASLVSAGSSCAYGLSSTIGGQPLLDQVALQLPVCGLEDSLVTASSVITSHNLFPISFGDVVPIATEAFPIASATDTDIDVLTGQADLVTVAFDANIDHVLTGGSTLTFTLANQGSVDADAFSVNIVYGDTLILGDPEDVIVQTISFEGLAAGEFLTQTVDVQLPVNLLNQRAIAEDLPNLGTGYISNHQDYIGLVVDPENTVAEVDEENNFNQGLGQDGDNLTYFPWDIDGSGVVTPTDAIYGINRLGQTDSAADFDGNGLVTAADAIALINRLGCSINATVVNDPNVAPIAVPDLFTVEADTQLSGNIFANNGLGVDSDVNGDSLTVVDHTLPAYGTLALEPDGTFSYRPNQGYTGPDSFEYRIADGAGGESPTVVEIIVSPPPNGPPVAVDDTVLGAEDSAITGNVLINDSDPDRDNIKIITNTEPLHGTLNLLPDGSFTYTPNSDYFGADKFTYTISDNQSDSTATVNITVTPVNDAPVAQADSFTVGNVTSITRNVLANDTDVDGPNLTVTSTTDAANGRVLLNSDGTITYVPHPSFVGTDSFSYTVSDNHTDSSLTDTATVTVTVEAIPLFDNTNIAAVGNNPLAPTTFSINRPYTVTSLQTYHWNNGQGDIPQGGYFLMDSTGRTSGSWAIQTSDGTSGGRNVDWSSRPAVSILPGTYTVLDPNPGTWAHNSGSGNAGFARVLGRPVDALITDTEFFNHDWTTETLRSTNGATVVTGQGFWPPQQNVRNMIYNLPAAGSLKTDLFVFHEFKVAAYTPASSGEILSINYSEDFIHFDPPFTGAEVLWQPALRQNGVVYLGPADRFSHFTYPANPGFEPYETGQMVNLAQDDFVAEDGSGRRPDFSSTGGAITFGYVRANTHTGPFSETRHHSIDNWQFALVTR